MALFNANSTDVVANATDTYLTGSSLLMVNEVQIGTIYRWRLSASKTAAGTGTPVFSLRVGAGATVTDTARSTFTGVAQTAATDVGWFELAAVVRATGATTVLQSVLKMEHKGTTGGMQNAAQTQILQSLSTGFNSTIANTQIGISVNPATAGVWTFQLVTAVVENNP